MAAELPICANDSNRRNRELEDASQQQIATAIAARYPERADIHARGSDSGWTATSAGESDLVSTFTPFRYCS